MMTPEQVRHAHEVSAPWDHFKTPAAVLASSLTVAEKKRALESWKLDARLRMTATEENMTGGVENDLRDVTECLHRLERDLSC